MSIERKIMLEQTLPFWKDLTKEQQELFCQCSTISRYFKGETVFNPLKKHAGLKIVWQGQMRISMLSGKGMEILLYQLKSKEICVLSVLSLMNQFEWNIYAEADQDSVVLSIPAQEYLKVSQENPAVHAYNQETTIQRMGEVIQITSQSAMANTEERLADLLLRYHRQERSMELCLTHESIAKDMGTAREVVSRTLKQFQKQGILEMGRGKIMLLDLSKLEHIKKG